MNKKKMNTHKISGMIFFAICVTLPIIHFCIFWLGTNTNSFLLAFQNKGEFTLDWFQMSFEAIFKRGGAMEEGSLAEGLKNTLTIFGMSNIFIFPLSVIFSYFLYKKIALHKFYRVVFFLPSIISAVVFVTLFMNILMKERKNRFARKSTQEIVTVCIVTPILFIWALSLLYPFFWATMNTFKTPSDFLRDSFAFPKEWHFENWVDAFRVLKVQKTNLSQAGMVEMIINSIWWMVGQVSISTFVTLLASYAIAKYPYKFGKFLYLFNIVIMAIPRGRGNEPRSKRGVREKTV